jgi:hypothetical protein
VWMFTAGRMVLRFFLGSHGTLTLVLLALTIMFVRDSCSKQLDRLPKRFASNEKQNIGST